jgi:hypothetical protein
MRGSTPRFTRPILFVWRINDEQDAARSDAYVAAAGSTGGAGGALSGSTLDGRILTVTDAKLREKLSGEGRENSKRGSYGRCY